MNLLNNKRKMMMYCKIYLLATLHLVLIQGHDSSKCLENGNFDNDCCAIKGSAVCKDDHVLRWGEPCYVSSAWSAIRYTCTPKKGYPAISNGVISNHQETKCLSNNLKDSSCCVPMNEGACADDFKMFWGASCGNNA